VKIHEFFMKFSQLQLALKRFLIAVHDQNTPRTPVAKKRTSAFRRRLDTVERRLLLPSRLAKEELAIGETIMDFPVLTPATMLIMQGNS
jgi:hypothetical protein